MKQDIYQKLGRLIERNDSIRWLGPNSFLGDRSSDFSGLKIFAKYVAEKKRKDPSSLTTPQKGNLLCIKFIEYLKSQAEENKTNEGLKRKYETMASKASNMLRPGADGEINDEIFVEYANVFHELGIGNESEEVMSKFFDALDKIKPLAPHLTKTIEGITSPTPKKLEGVQGGSGLGGQKAGEIGMEGGQGIEGGLGAEGGATGSQSTFSLKAKTGEAVSFNLKEEIQRQPSQKKETKPKEDELKAPEEKEEIGKEQGGEFLIPSEGEAKPEQKEFKKPEESEKEKLGERAEEPPKEAVEEPNKEEEKGEGRGEIPQRREVQTEQIPISISNLSETRFTEPTYFSEPKTSKRRKTIQKRRAETDERMRRIAANRRAEEKANEEELQRQRAAQSEQSGGGKIAKRMAKIGAAGAGLGFIKILYGAGATKQAVAMTFALIKIIF